MEIIEEYTFSNDRQIWRLLPTDTDKLVIEERNPETKEVFFNCLDINSGVKIFSDLQLDEKFWVGIEAIHKDIIYFHRFVKPDMPGHKDIIAFDISAGEFIWETTEYSFLFIKDDLVYCFKSLFEGKNYFSLRYNTGELQDELGNNSAVINSLMEQTRSSQNFDDYIFPESFNPGIIDNENINNYLSRLQKEVLIAGKIDYALYRNILLFNYHEFYLNGKLRNNFKAIEVDSGKILFEETLNKESNVLIPDSFFMRENLLFLLREKSALVVCSLKD